MTLTGLAIALSGAGALVTGALAVLFLRDPLAGLAQTTHRAGKASEVMADRYVGMVLLAAGATLYGDLKVIAVLFSVFAYLGFHDAWIYARGGFPIAKHVSAGVAGLIVSLVAVIAMGQGGVMRSVMLGLALAAMPALAQAETVSSERIEAFVAVMTENGCRMSPHRADVIMSEVGFDDKAETKAITERLIVEERARVMDGQLVVFGGGCGGRLDYSGRERLFAALADNNCAMTTKEAPALLGRVSVEMPEVRLLMEQMLRMSEVRLSKDEKAVYLEQSLCDTFKGLSAEMATSAPAPKVAPRSAEELRPVIARVVADGEAVMDIETVSLKINKELCAQ